MTRTHVDRGGTFTDIVEVRDGRAVARKVRSDVARVGHLTSGPLTFGTTVATNALLEGRRVRTCLLITAGFGDLPWIRAMARPALFDADADWPAPLVDAVIEVDERMAADGAVVRPLQLPEAALEGFDAVAIALLHAPANPAHEQALVAWVRDRAPDAYVSCGHERAPDVGLLARVETTVLDAAVTPLLRAALAADALPADALALRSDGSLVAWPALTAPDAVLSGPAGGVLAVAQIAAALGAPAAVGFDMGGTSTDVCCVRPGRLERRVGERVVAGHVVHRRDLPVETIAAGGGSVVWRDGIQLRVGPASAGADPGPQCYGRGGPPTLTDAALAAGLVDALAFDPPLDPTRVDLPAPADELLDVAREQMAAAIRRVCGAAGVDPAEAPLVAYGGAAGQHAAAVAQAVGMPEVVVHGMASVLSAWGQGLAAQEEEAVTALWAPLAAAWPQVPGAVDRLDARLPGWPEREVWLDLRPVGGDHALEVSWTPTTSQDAVRAVYGEQHRAVFGFDPPPGEVELASVRVRRRAPPAPPPPVGDPWGVGERVVAGPTRLDGGGTSVHVPAGWSARWSAGLLRLTPDAPVRRPEPTARTDHGVAVWSSRLTDVAVRAGEHLRRLARSVNIRERLDFSCAVFDGDGHLVVNAPHIPVHLGAMGETVRDLLRHVPHPADGDAWLTNDPLAGGSHLPDLTVITCVRHGPARFFVACRGHHVDVGGVTPGSMPPRATRLAEEGACVARLPLVVGGVLGDLSPLLSASRQPDVVAADLNAQLASNRLAASLLRSLGPPEVVAAWCQHLMDAADEALRRTLPSLVDGQAEDSLDGVPLRLALRVQRDTLEIDLTGTGGPHPGNLNAPPAVLRAAVLYVLRGLVDDGLPLNEGALRSVRLVVPHPSIVSPPPGAAVAGGNVETSQRLVDLLLAALGRRAGSQGTMNNLTLGGDGWSLYETLGGGSGATPAGPGRSGRQVHMTNTRATDPEVLERRLPLRVRRFALRRGSGGAGAQAGGDGLVRELEVLAPAEVSLLASRRDRGGPGAAGGGDGAPGRDQLERAGVWSAWDGATVALLPGDAARVETPGGGGWGRQSRSDLAAIATRRPRSG